MELVSALVCTRNRPDSVIRTVLSFLKTDSPAFELIVVDQSDEQSRPLLGAIADPRLRYQRSKARGKGAALNEGLRLARGRIVACTDDDCEATPEWPAQMARVMDANPQAAIVFCNVIAPPHDPAAGYVPAYERTTDRVLRSIGDARGAIGLGAGMALRREAVLAFGGFDETFGPGARFSSGDDWDIAVRALLHGWHVYETSNVSVVHHGFRSHAEGKTHALRDWIAIGAISAKTLRAGHFSTLPFSLSLLVGEALWPPMRSILTLRRPRGMSRLVGFTRGFTRGLRTPVDPQTLVFRV
jgi:glycosyltransferase involved in cell wall biosynthesis